MAQQPRQVAHTLVARLKVKGEEYALVVLEQMARLLGREITEKQSAG
jgi:prolyl-tRNA editing enzyme YbaK/EbsC (Cys-tRNA(Pro) deacylase)